MKKILSRQLAERISAEKSYGYWESIMDILFHAQKVIIQ